MKHRSKKRKFGRKSNKRNALLKSLANSLVENEGITTTEAKAKELRPYIEKLLTKAKTNDLSTKRLIIRRLGSPSLSKKLMEVIAPKYKEQNGGYTRIVKLPLREKDAAKMAHIEFV